MLTVVIHIVNGVGGGKDVDSDDGRLVLLAVLVIGVSKDVDSSDW